MQLKKLIDKGVNINQLDEKERVPLQYLINLKYTGEELEPCLLYTSPSPRDS